MKPASIPFKILIFSFLVIPLISQAQRRPGNFRLGFTTSPTIGWMEFQSDDPNYSSSGPKIGYSYGLIGDFGFTPNYYFSSGFTLTTMSASVKATFPTGTEEIGYKIQYIDIPFTLKLKSSSDTYFRFYGQFGPDLGIKVSGKHDFTQLDVRNDSNVIRLGLLVGAGAEWQLKQSHLLTGISYNNGFTKVFNNPDVKNHIVTLNFGVFF